MIPPHPMEEPAHTEAAGPEPAETPPTPGLRQDLAVLMKVRLNFFVLVTAFFGFLLASRGGSLDCMKLVHTIFGAAAAAFGSAAFNQLMEIELDARMKRTAAETLEVCARRLQTVC